MTCPGRLPVNRITPDEWYQKLFRDLQSAQEITDDVQKYRAKVEQELESVRIQDLKDENDVPTSGVVPHEMNDIATWIKKLKKVFNHVELEIELLIAAKKAAETSLQSKSVPHEVNKFCLILRDRRATFEAVQDTVEEELLREAKLIENAKIVLNKKCNESFDLICKLQSVRTELEEDLRTKKSNLSANCTKLNTPIKKNRIPDIAVSQFAKKDEETRALKTKDVIKTAEVVMNTAQIVRDDIYRVIVQTEDAILNHKQKTDYEYHKRMHEIGIALEELRWQKKNIEDEVESLNDLLLNLQDSLQAKTNKLKLIETRLQSLSSNDKCSDVYRTLTNERNRIKSLQKSLQKSIANTKGKVNALLSTLHLIENNLRDKSITQQLDQACMEERKKVNTQNANRTKQRNYIS